MRSELAEIVTRAGFVLHEDVTLPGQEPVFHPVPDGLHPQVVDVISKRFPEGIYSHQARAVATLVGGRDICLATPTASGKSLVFLVYSVDLLLRDPDARVIAFYPAKALIQDQLGKWLDMLEPLGIPLGYIDGGVPVGARTEILRTNRVVLMTPDVAHAWLMSNLETSAVQGLLDSLRLLVLDEAHVYEGVFGTNMAYLIRRFQAVTASHRLVCSTATIDDPAGFVHKLTGRDVEVFADGDNGARVAARRVVSIRPMERDSFDGIVNLVRQLGESYVGRFLVFADSRRMVELVVAGLTKSDDSNEDGDSLAGIAGVLPYRAGYEEDDRASIQQALRLGELKGVVSTSALELGLDIGEIDLVVLLGVPPTMKAFWQRVGRAGRRSVGTCVMVDDAGDVAAVGETLQGFLERPLEPSWLYLDNRYIQYAHALCMAVEVRARGGGNRAEVLKPAFQDMLDNELDQTEMIAADLYPLKQRAQGDPHHQFPLRSGIEPSFRVEGPFLRLGSLSWSQVLREAYPGAVYYYMARPFRIKRILFRRQLLKASRAGGFITRPISQVMVFPSFEDPMALWRSQTGFVADVPMQVSERVLGFREHRGTKKVDHMYGPKSSWSRRELTRFFETTGVCWFFKDAEVHTDEVANALVDAFSLRFGIQRSDLGVGDFFAKQSPLGPNECRGICIYDATHGSLRLTQRFAEHISEVVSTAMAQAEDDGLVNALERLSVALDKVKKVRLDFSDIGTNTSEADSSEVVEVVADGEMAVHVTDSEVQHVRVKTWRYTPHGLMYEIECDTNGVKKHMVPAHAVRPLLGETRLVKVNLVSGEQLTCTGD